MSQFHITTEGQARRCNATQRACPLGGEHYNSMREAAIAAAQHPSTRRMRRPKTMTDQDWDNFEYELAERGSTQHEYESYLTEIDSSLEEEWSRADHRNNYYPPPRQLVAAMGDHANYKWKRQIAAPLADEVLSRYLNPLQASLYAEEFSIRIVAYHDATPNGILRDGISPSSLADQALEGERFQETAKAFMFDKLWGESS